MEAWIRAVLIVLCSILGSGGFWKFLETRNQKTSAESRLMMGIAYDKITTLGINYIQRGWITKDELEEFERYFVDPYLDLGGNGIAERIWGEVKMLPFRKHVEHERIFSNERYIPDVPVVTPQ